MIRWLGTNLRIFLLAFALALAVWVAAVTAADPDEVRQFPNPIPVEIVGLDPGLVITNDYPKQIELTLRAPRSVWNRLVSEEGGVRAVLDLSGLGEGQHTLDIQIQIPTRPVRIVSVTPETFTLTLEPFATRTLPVNIVIGGEPAIGYQAGEASIEPNEVIVSGPQSLVEKVDRLRVSVNLSGVRESVDQTPSVQALDVNGLPISGLSLNPSSVDVTIPVSQQGGYRDLAVKVVVQGQVASGYRLTNISVFPPVVTVFSGDPTVVNSLPGVLETQPLELENASDDITIRLGLNLPEGVSMVGEQTVLVQVGISPIQGSLTLSNKQIEVIGLPEGWAVQVSPDNVDVILSGPLPLLDTLTPQDVRVTVNVTDLDSGIHQLVPRVEILIADISVESILPGTVEVVLNAEGILPSGTSTPAPTPTP